MNLSHKKAADSKAVKGATSKSKSAANAVVQEPVQPTAKVDGREKVIKERFHPDAVNYLKEVFDIDLNNPRISLSDVYNIAAGRATSPIEARIKTLAYDKDTKQDIEKGLIKTVASFRFKFPADKQGKPIAFDAKNVPYIESYPCYDYLERKDLHQPASLQQDKPKEQLKELPVFSKEQTEALEAVGVAPARLFAGQFNSLPLSLKRDILDSKPFDLNGSVRVPSPIHERGWISLNVNGRARLLNKTVPTVLFEPQYPVKAQTNSILDIKKISRIGNKEFDFYERDMNNRVKLDVYNNPIINQAAKDLIRYGHAFEPVTCFIHKATFNKQTNKTEYAVERKKYQVSVLNGGLCAHEMVLVKELDNNGKPIKVVMNGVERDKAHYEVKNPGVSKEGTIFISGQELKPASPQDLENYKRGQGGTFLGYKAVDATTKKESVYDVFAVPDNRKGFARGFSEKVSQELASRKEENRRKQNFSLGF